MALTISQFIFTVWLFNNIYFHILAGHTHMVFFYIEYEY